MDESFWHNRWASNRIGFHNADANPLLVTHFHAVSPRTTPCVFVPLCGKSHDLLWLHRQGCRVTGAELSEIAVKQFFEELGVKPQIITSGKLQRYEGQGITVFQGSVFDLTPDLLGAVDLVYDRAALVAFPPEMRDSYAKHLLNLTAGAPQLLIGYEYDQMCTDGPPFSVVEEEIRLLYQASLELQLLGRYEVTGGLQGKYPLVRLYGTCGSRRLHRGQTVKLAETWLGEQA